MKNAMLVTAIVAALASAGAAAAHADPAVVGLLAALVFATITIWAGLAALALRAPDAAPSRAIARRSTNLPRGRA